MALTGNNLALIRAVAANDFVTAKRAAKASLIEDKTQKNAKTVSALTKMLENGTDLLANLPSDIKAFLVGESMGSFDPAKYFVRARDKDIVSSVVRMRRVADKLAEKGIPYKNTTLLYGPPGTGKTELGRYIAHQLGLPFFYVRFVATIDSYLGSTAKNMHKVFDFCKTIPCVLMLDEIDCFAVKRASGKGADGELERTTISVMQDIDQLPNRVVLIGATNRADILDGGVRRRFVLQHEVPNMTENEIRVMLLQYVSATQTEAYVRETDLLEIAKTCVTPGTALPALIRRIGEGMYKETEDESVKNLMAAGNLWQVRYMWQTDVTAKTKEQAIAIGRSERMRGENGKQEYYDASPVSYEPCP